MDQTNTSYKQEAQMALSRGDLKKALKNYQSQCLLDPDDLRSCLKIGEVQERLGRKKEAIKAYQEVAEAYAKNGYLLQAISVNKIILRIDPSLKEANDRLAQLYIEKTVEVNPIQPLPPIPLFSDLSEQELKSLLSRVHDRVFPEETYICRQGDMGDSLLVVSRGEIGIFKRNREGQEVWIDSRSVGDFFGEFSFFTDRKRYASVKAMTECEVLEISRSELEEVIKVHPRVKEVLYDFFRERVVAFFLALSPLFSSLTSTERREVAKRFRLHHVPEETILFRKEDPPTCLYMVKSGEVEVSTQNRQGHKVVLDNQKSGNFFGELSLLLNRPRMTQAKTTRSSELLELTKEDFGARLAQFSALQSVVQQVSAKRLIRIEEVLSQESLISKESMV